MRNDAIVILFFAIGVSACDDKPLGNAGPPSDLRPISIRVDGPTEVTPPAEVQFTALQMWSDGSTRDVTASAQWASSNPSVLSVNAGVAKALAAGEVRLSAHVDQLPVNPKGVRVVPAMPEWDGAYTLTIGGGPCSSSLPLEPGLRRRRYTAAIRQNGLTLAGAVSNVGGFEGRITNPEVRFTMSRAGGFSRRVHKASILGMLPLTGVHNLELFAARKAAYSAGQQFEEILDGDRLVISGQAVTTMSSSGFAGTLNGSLALYDGRTGQLIGVCSSSSHEFTLIRI